MYPCVGASGAIGGNTSELPLTEITDMAELSESQRAEIRQLIENLNERATLYRKYANFIALVSGVILLIAITVFIYSGTIEREDIERSKTAANIAAMQNLTTLDNRIGQLGAEIALSLSDREMLEALRNKRLEQIQAFPVLAPGNAGGESNPFLANLQVNITRFGTFLLLSYIASVFIGFYRNYMRLSAYYSTRAETFSFVSMHGLTDQILSDVIFVTPTVDLGKTRSILGDGLSKITEKLFKNPT